MELAIALIVVALIGYGPSRKAAKAAQRTAEAAHAEAKAAAAQTKTSNGMTTGTMVEAVYHRVARIETNQDHMQRSLELHVADLNPHGWDPDYAKERRV